MLRFSQLIIFSMTVRICVKLIRWKYSTGCVMIIENIKNFQRIFKERKNCELIFFTSQ